MTKRLVPALRFKGFDGEWERNILGEIGNTFTSLSGKNSDDFGHGKAKYITYMNVYLNPISDLDMTGKIEIDNRQTCVKRGDIFFTTSSETPDEVGMSSVWLGNEDNVYLNSFCFGYRLQKKYDLHYLAYNLRAETFRRKVVLLAQGISRYNISKNKVMDIDILSPSLSEQQKIGTFMSDLDKRITEQRQKIEKLKNFKKALLAKLFPAKGSKIPALRFKGFDEEWEEKTVDELGKQLSKVQDELNKANKKIHALEFEAKAKIN